MYQFWTEEDEHILIKNCGFLSMNEIANLLPNRSYSAIAYKISKMGLSTVDKKRWSEEEICLLRKHYSYLSNSELIATYLPSRTIKSVEVLANKLKLKKDRETINNAIGNSVYTSYSNKRYDQIYLIEKLIELSVNLKRIPTSRDIYQDKEITPSMMAYRTRFGSYSNAILAAGLKPNKSKYRTNLFYYAKNNEKCFSFMEMTITNILIDNNINYTKEVYYKDITNDPRCGLKRCDWLINGVVVEYFGLAEIDSYKEKYLEKVSICDDNNIPLISLFQSDIDKKDKKSLIEKFKHFEIHINTNVA